MINLKWTNKSLVNSRKITNERNNERFNEEKGKTTQPK